MKELRRLFHLSLGIVFLGLAALVSLAFCFVSAKGPSVRSAVKVEIEIRVDGVVRLREDVSSDWAVRSFSTSGGHSEVRFRCQQDGGVDVEIKLGRESKSDLLQLGGVSQIEFGNVLCTVHGSTID